MLRRRCLSKNTGQVRPLCRRPPNNADGSEVWSKSSAGNFPFLSSLNDVDKFLLERLKSLRKPFLARENDQTLPDPRSVSTGSVPRPTASRTARSIGLHVLPSRRDCPWVQIFALPYVWEWPIPTRSAEKLYRTEVATMDRLTLWDFF
jgi:hypothetical protein